MTITPDEWVYASHGEVKISTVKNNGPDQSLPLHRGIFGGNASPSNFVTVQDNCVGRQLVPGDSCTIGAQHIPRGGCVIWRGRPVASSGLGDGVT